MHLDFLVKLNDLCSRLNFRMPSIDKIDGHWTLTFYVIDLTSSSVEELNDFFDTSVISFDVALCAGEFVVSCEISENLPF